jgi:hypothetical protein
VQADDPLGPSTASDEVQLLWLLRQLVSGASVWRLLSGEACNAAVTRTQ